MIDTERRQRVVHVMLDSPPVNVLDAELLGELVGELGRCAADEELAAVLLEGKGRCFSAGAAVAEHTAELAPGMLSRLMEACLALADLPAPTVAMVHGVCLGGACELVSFCDFVVADPSAKLGVPEISLAFFPPFACSRLPQLTGRQNAAYAVLTGESIPAERAAAMGLVQEVLAKEDWGRIEERFNGLSAPVLRLAKQALRVGAGGAERSRLANLRDLFLEKLYAIDDVNEGIASFEERRPPRWRHR